MVINCPIVSSRGYSYLDAAPLTLKGTERATICLLYLTAALDPLPLPNALLMWHSIYIVGEGK